MVDAVYCGKTQIDRIYFGGEIIFQGVQPFDFHIIEDGKLIIVGTLFAKSYVDGLYLDCEPKIEWIHPVKNGNVLTIEQVYSATQNGNVLGVE